MMTKLGLHGAKVSGRGEITSVTAGLHLLPLPREKTKTVYLMDTCPRTKSVRRRGERVTGVTWRGSWVFPPTGWLTVGWRSAYVLPPSDVRSSIHSLQSHATNLW